MNKNCSEAVEIRSNIIGTIFSGSVKLQISKEGFTIVRRNTVEELKIENTSDLPKVTYSFWGAKLSISDLNGNYTFRFLDRSSTVSAYPRLLDAAIAALEKRITETYVIFRAYAFEQFLRDSSIPILKISTSLIAKSYAHSRDMWKANLSKAALEQVVSLMRSYPVEKNIESLRDAYEQRRLMASHRFFDIAESNPLTQQQRLAVIRNNDRNLVLAAAGTGKTSVIVAKALDLIVGKFAQPEELLILAFNRTAALELRDRISERAEAFGIEEESLPKVSTFHALGLSILKDAKDPSLLSDFADDEKKLLMWATKWLLDRVSSSSKSLKEFIDLSYQPINPFDFKTKAEYDAYVRDNEYRTLQGERVRGYQELLIANWLYLNGIDYEYEAPYVTKRRIDIGFDYRPDFHIKNTSIYIEHFGIDRKGNTRPDINKADYNLKMQSKRRLHTECETTLVETFHFDWIEENLEERLETQLRELGIEVAPRDESDVLQNLKSLGFIDESSKRYLKCLKAIRAESLTKEGILERLNANKIEKAKEYTELLHSFTEAYKSELDAQHRIDFDDMIHRAIDAISFDKFRPKWKHILVDEFQDISMARMNLVRSLISSGDNPTLTVVGDDWQSIYRFSGGKLELTTRFDQLVGSCTRTTLEKTYRYNNSIADIAGTFIMENPEQYTKEIHTDKIVNDPQVYLLDSYAENGNNNLEERTWQIISKIRQNDRTGSIAILARYNYLLENAEEYLRAKPRVSGLKFWTFHRSKGLEADYCVLVGFFQGKTGFPNQNKEEAVVEALLPTLDSFEHSEERRLFYVALTRAINKSYLIADPRAPSEFITELLSPKYEVNIGSKTFEAEFRKIFKCPHCEHGYFRPQTGKFGKFYSCSSGSVCPSKPRICEKCGAPSLDQRRESICNNTHCSQKLTICDVCGRPMKIRKGRYGEFWGCTGYGISEDQCKNTRKLTRK